MKLSISLCLLAACGGSSSSGDEPDAPRYMGMGPSLGPCPMFPTNHIFNTPIDKLPVHPNSAAYISVIDAARHVHLDMGTTTDQTSDTFYGIPYNLYAASGATWPAVDYTSPNPDYSWDPTDESDCADGSKNIVSPCTISSPHLPFPASPIVEGGLSTAADQLPDGDHHLIVVDTDTCRLWEGYHVYKPSAGWQIFGSATFDLTKTEMRPDTWTSADAAGFPILPLLLRADEASSGAIHHALRFTIQTSKIRNTYVWPATHHTNGPSQSNYPQMGQLFRLRADYQPSATAGTQTKAIITALKTYGMYIADGGSDMFITGTPDATWADDTFNDVQDLTAGNFEAVDMDAIMSKPGWSATSAAVP